MSENGMSDRKRFDLLFEAIAETRALTNENSKQIAAHSRQIADLREELHQLGQLVLAHMKVTQEHGKQIAEQGREIRDLAAIVRDRLT